MGLLLGGRAEVLAIRTMGCAGFRIGSNSFSDTRRRRRANEKAAADDARGGQVETDVLCWVDQFTTPTFCSATEFLPLAVFAALSAKIVTLRIVPFVTEPISCVARDFSPEAMLRALLA